jgi:prevent-host-death family protein
MSYKTYNLYIELMDTPPPPQTQPAVDVSFRGMEFHVEVSVSHARAHLPELLEGVRDSGTVYLTRYGKRIAALVPADAGEYLDRMEDEYWSKRAKEATDSTEPSIPWAQVVAELEVADNR